MGPEEFDYNLPEELIAQYPLEARDASRLMVLSKEDGALGHGRFGYITSLLRSGDVLVLNDTKVTAARLIGKKPTGGKVEFLLVRKTGESGEGGEVWECMVKPAKGLKAGTTVEFNGSGDTGDNGGTLNGTVLTRGSSDNDVLWSCELRAVGANGGPAETSKLIESLGRVPLPPYIRRADEDVDRERYQTVFATTAGAVAAPTAGLHFTEGLLAEIMALGVEVYFITLHTGPATFLPVRARDVRDHRVPGEYFCINHRVADAVKRAKDERRRVIAVGTTVTRALETVFGSTSGLPALEGFTDLFIYPGFEFKAVDGLLTNFHLPRSSLIMLAAALAGRERILKAYEEAVGQGYRFYSYGDAMLII